MLVCFKFTVISAQKRGLQGPQFLHFWVSSRLRFMFVFFTLLVSFSTKKHQWEPETKNQYRHSQCPHISGFSEVTFNKNHSLSTSFNSPLLFFHRQIWKCHSWWTGRLVKRMKQKLLTNQAPGPYWEILAWPCGSSRSVQNDWETIFQILTQANEISK